MLTAGAFGVDAAVALPPACQLVQKVPGCSWLVLADLLLPILMLDGGAAAGVFVVGACTVMAVNGVAAVVRRSWSCCPGDAGCRLSGAIVIRAAVVVMRRGRGNSMACADESLAKAHLEGCIPFHYPRRVHRTTASSHRLRR